jgi:uncharacterized protein YkwD
MRASAPLSRAARRHSREMLLGGYLGHVGPGGITPAARIRSAGYLGKARSWSIGEALAFSSTSRATPASLVSQLRRSPPHRAILLSPTLRDIGIGVAAGGRGVMLTIDGGRRG